MLTSLDRRDASPIYSPENQIGATTGRVQKIGRIGVPGKSGATGIPISIVEAFRYCEGVNGLG
jgi:hypothetical protein